MKKYELVQSKEAPRWFNVVALVNFGDVRKGDMGGFVQSERNLSQFGFCWIHGDAKVCDPAMVTENAEIRDYSIISGNTVISGDVSIRDSSNIENATISGDVKVSGHSDVRDCTLSGALELENVRINGNSICENTTHNNNHATASIKDNK